MAPGIALRRFGAGCRALGRDAVFAIRGASRGGNGVSGRFLGIEIGGTKLQVGVGEGSGPPLLALRRTEVQPEKGAEGIRAQIAELAAPLIAEYRPEAAGIAFGGPLDARAGRTLLSLHIAGWEDFPLADWCRETLGLPAVLGGLPLGGLVPRNLGFARRAGKRR